MHSPYLTKDQKLVVLYIWSW